MSGRTADYLVVGGGIVGLSIATALRRRYPDCSVVLLEKEPECGRHASGRNSGVLHAGFYYTADSLKARFSRDGNRELTEYCLENGLRIHRCGKLVVARSADELDSLRELFRRAGLNGVPVERVGEEEAARLEPEARTCREALYSPTTATVDPPEVVRALARDAARLGVEIRTGTSFEGRERDRVLTSSGTLSVGYVINAAGLYADRVARQFGFAEEYRILPFRGLYIHYEGDGSAPRMHIYPVPRLDHPFLGVHWTTTVDGGTMIGPTAIPALWREHYRGLRAFRFNELAEIGVREADLWIHDSFDFRRLAWQELRKHSRRRLATLARGLTRSSTARGPWRWGAPGVRAQLFHVPTRSLEMDFRCQGDDRSFHVLNAVSPAFTCALPFARYVVDQIESLLDSSCGREVPETLVGVEGSA
jgi:L-2-hydroxyglutarate oxidase LhgO